MSTPGPDDSTVPSTPSPELGGLDPKDLFHASLETVPPVTLPPQPVDSDATIAVNGPRLTLAGNQNVDLPLPEELSLLLPHGNYVVESFLGQGGMGAVYKGLQIRLKRPVAIKIMRRDLGKDHDFEARFEREAQAMAKLNHPNIVSVIDFGEAGPDYLYIVMELIDGADLMDVIRGGQMTQEMALSLLPQICDALQFAHDHGIVHRDIKPSNIMLTRDGRIKMADFGLAKHFDTENSFRTQTGTGMGTPDYAAPEQFSPDTPIDHRADIYALGVMIYQMITGQLPRGVWKPPSQRAQIDPHWDDIVSRAMQNDPCDRYQQASDIKTDVSSIPLAGGTAASPSAATSGPEATNRQSAALGGRIARPKTKSHAPLLFGVIAGGAVLAIGAFLAFKQPVQNQTPAPTSAISPNLPVSKTNGSSASEKWQDILHDPAKLVLSAGAEQRPEGLLFSNAGAAMFVGQHSDGAVRIRATFGGSRPMLRVRSRSAVGDYQLSAKDQNAIRLSVYDGVSKQAANKREFPLREPLQPGQDYELELRVTGQVLTAKLNGEVLGTITDGSFTEGEFGVRVTDRDSAPALVKSLEFLDLDKPVSASPSLQASTSSPTVSIPGLPDLPPLNIPLGELGLVKEIPLQGSLIRAVALLPDSRRIMVVRDQFTDLIDLETGASLWTTDGGIATSSDLTPDGSKFVDYRLLTPDGRDFAGGAGEFTHARITLRETATGKVIQSWKVPASKMSNHYGQVAISPSGQTILARMAGTDTKEGKNTRFIALRPGLDKPFAEWNTVDHVGHTTHCLEEDMFLSIGGGAPVFLKPSMPEEKLPVPESFAKAFFGSVLSPQRNRLIACENLVVKVWDMKTRQPLFPLQDKVRHDFQNGTFAGESVALCIDEPRKIKVWSTATGNLLTNLPQPTADYTFGSNTTGAANGEFFVTTAKPDRPTSGKDVRYLQIFRLPKPAPSQPSALPASASTVSIPGLPDLPPLSIPPGEPGLVKEWQVAGKFLRATNVLPDNRRLLIFQDDKITLFDMEKEVSVWTTAAGIAKSTACSRDGARFADCCFEQEDGKAVDGPVKAHRGRISLRVTATGETVQSWTFPVVPMAVPNNRISISDDGKTIVAGVGGMGYGKGDAIFLAFQEGKQEPIAQWRDAQHNGHVTICLGGNRFLSTGNEQALLLDVNAPEKTDSPFEGKLELRSDISPDRKWLVAAESAFSFLWDVGTHKRVRALKDSPAALAETSFAGNDLIVALSPFKGADTITQRFMGVWDVNDGRLLARLKASKAGEYFETLECASNGSFCLTKVRHWPVPPGSEPTLIQIYRLPKPGEVHSSAKQP